MTGEVETEDGVLVIKRVHVRYTLQVPAEQRETAERVHEVHAKYCPVARSVGGSIDVSTELHMVEPDD